MPSPAEAVLLQQARETLVRRRWWIVVLLFFAGLINYFDRTIVSVALPAIADELHLGPERMGVLLSAFFWSYALMQVPIGWLSDRYNLRWLYAGCFALWSVTCGLTGFAASLSVLLVLRVFLGIGESIYLPGGMKLVSVLFPPKDRGLASGLTNCGTRAGLAFGAPLIAAIVGALGWRSAFFILGFTSLIWLVPWLAGFPRGASTASREEPAAQSGWRRIDRNLLAISLANVGYGYFFYLLVTWLPTYLVKARHLPLSVAAGYAVAPYLTFALGEPIGGWIADRLSKLGWDETRARKAVITAAYCCGALLIPADMESNTSYAVLLIAGASLVGLSSGNIYALVQRISPAGNVGFSIGLFNLAGNLSGVAAPLITGVIIAQTGSYFPAFCVAVAVLLATLPLFWMAIRLEPVRREK
jgi:MFS family permease